MVPAWHALDPAAVAGALESGARGLDAAEAAARLAHWGPNALPEARVPSRLLGFLRQFANPLIYLLLAATLISVALGDTVDAVVIGVVLLLNATIGFIQEQRAEHSVRALRRLASPHARVLREGREAEIESAGLVPGDVVLLESGARVPADVRLSLATALLVDESLLTGEAAPVHKRPEPVAEDSPVADRRDMLYAGTVVASGRGRGYVVATGAATELGGIAAQLQTGERSVPPLQLRLARFARIIGIVVVVAAALSFAAGILAGEGLAKMFLVAVALAVSAVPEGLPVASTITLTLGVRRMAGRQAIVRRLASVETLGSTTVIGSDKTGTLTQNRMTVTEIRAGGRNWVQQGTARGGAVAAPVTAAAVAEDRALYLTLLAGVLTNEADLRVDAAGGEAAVGDPTEVALLRSARQADLDPAELQERYPVLAEVPFEPDLQYSAALRKHGGGQALFLKGSPERVLAMSNRQLGRGGGLEPLDPEAILAQVSRMAAGGLRVLAMAWRELEAGTPSSIEAPSALVFLGLQGMLDPPRPGVHEAIAGCREAGIRVVMITGDHADTARAIARELSLAAADTPALTGRELDAMDEVRLREEVARVSVYARVSPAHKLRVVRALQARGEVVAVTGDGINDAPALQAADVGIAMGRSGTDVAREAADIVLVDDNFVSIYGAVAEGRVTFDNIRKIAFFLLSTNVAEVLIVLMALALGWPLPLIAVQLLWLNLATEGVQHLALAFEPAAPDTLHRPPRSPRAGLLSRVLWQRTVLSGLVQAAGVLLLFNRELTASGSLIRAQTVALTTLVLFETFQIGNARSESRSVFAEAPWSNPWLILAAVAALAAHVGALYLPVARRFLHLAPLDGLTWVRMVLVAATILAAVELDKLRWKVKDMTRRGRSRK